jgi:type I restriction enzyme, S subunit
MKLNYKPLGDYVKQVTIRNTGLQVKKLIGVSMNKMFIESVANINGVDFENYKVIKKNQFACKLMSVGRDKKLPVDLLKDYDEAIVSSAYYVFEVIDKNVLLPEYLMMWFRRSESDRYVGFISGGDVRGGISWDDLCTMPIIVPDIDTQKEIVQEYGTIISRIELNNQLIQKLEETAQAIYKQWFVDFEFPEENGNPYKSSGGEMEYNEELDQDIPKGWSNGFLEEIIDLFDSKRVPLSKYERNKLDKIYPYYGAASILDYVDKYLFDGIYILMGEDGSVVTPDGFPILQYVSGKFWVNNHAHVIKGKNGFDENSIYLLLSNLKIGDIITGGVQGKINQENLNSILVCIPKLFVIQEFNQKIKGLFNNFVIIKKDILLLEDFRQVLLSKMSKIPVEVLTK